MQVSEWERSRRKLPRKCRWRQNFIVSVSSEMKYLFKIVKCARTHFCLLQLRRQCRLPRAHFVNHLPFMGELRNEERQWNKSFIKTILNELISRRYFSVLVSLARQTHGHDLCKHSKKILSTNFLIWKFYTQILHFFKMRSFKILWEWFMNYFYTIYFINHPLLT